MAPRLILLGTSACTLCDQAEALARPLAEAFGWRLELCDIVDDDNLLADYGERIPVLKRSDLDAELCWPFDARDVQRLVSEARDGGEQG